LVVTQADDAMTHTKTMPARAIFQIFFMSKLLKSRLDSKCGVFASPPRKFRMRKGALKANQVAYNPYIFNNFSVITPRTPWSLSVPAQSW
jgi:hypothetical protein